MIWYFTFSSVSSSARRTMAPNFTTLPENFEKSITSARETMLSISMMRPSMKPCFSRADVYSAFSDRSPCSRAVAIALMIAGRSMLFRCFSSSSRFLSPSAVVGIFSMTGSSSMIRTASTGNQAPWLRYRTNKPDKSLESALEIRLQWRHVEGPRLHGRDSLDRRLGAGDRRVIGDLVHQRSAPQREAVGQCHRPIHRIEHELDLVVLHQVDDVRPAFEHLVDPLRGNAMLGQEVGGAVGRHDLEAELDQPLHRLHHVCLVGILHRHEHRAGDRHLAPCTQLRLGEGAAEIHV